MRSNLMAAMGLGKMNPQGSQSAKRRSARQSDFPDNSALTESSIPFIDILGAACLSTTQKSAPQDAPSPKRARSRKSMASRVSTTGRAPRSSTQSKRLPLVAVDGNVSPSKSANNKNPYSSAIRGFDGGFDDTTFDESEVFASTPGMSMEGRDGEAEELPEDDTEMA
jgi:hypothetical protein